MSILLNIDTAVEIATLSISDNGKVIASVSNNNQKDHASFLQPAIKILLQKVHLSINELNAVAVTSGPGSYTGLRVGMASAKGLCYALKIPLITLNTLEVMALSSINGEQDKWAFYCPMIDARRMEVFTAVYDFQLLEIKKPCSMVLDNETFKDLLRTNKMYFSGNGAVKFRDIMNNEEALFGTAEHTTDAMAQLSYQNFTKNNFADVLYASPEYLKEFYTLLPRK